jgi:hypothetical protein
MANDPLRFETNTSRTRKYSVTTVLPSTRRYCEIVCDDSNNNDNPWLHGLFSLALASLRFTSIDLSGIFLCVPEHLVFLWDKVVSPAPNFHYIEDSDFLSGFIPLPKDLV